MECISLCGIPCLCALIHPYISWTSFRNLFMDTCIYSHVWWQYAFATNIKFQTNLKCKIIFDIVIVDYYYAAVYLYWLTVHIIRIVKVDLQQNLKWLSFSPKWKCNTIRKYIILNTVICIHFRVCKDLFKLLNTSPPTAHAEIICPPKQPKNELDNSSQIPSVSIFDSLGHIKTSMWWTCSKFSLVIIGTT